MDRTLVLGPRCREGSLGTGSASDGLSLLAPALHDLMQVVHARCRGRSALALSAFSILLWRLTRTTVCGGRRAWCWGRPALALSASRSCLRAQLALPRAGGSVCVSRTRLWRAGRCFGFCLVFLGGFVPECVGCSWFVVVVVCAGFPPWLCRLAGTGSGSWSRRLGPTRARRHGSSG